MPLKSCLALLEGMRAYRKIAARGTRTPLNLTLKRITGGIKQETFSNPQPNFGEGLDKCHLYPNHSWFAKQNLTQRTFKMTKPPLVLPRSKKEERSGVFNVRIPTVQIVDSGPNSPFPSVWIIIYTWGKQVAFYTHLTGRCHPSCTSCRKWRIKPSEFRKKILAIKFNSWLIQPCEICTRKNFLVKKQSPSASLIAPSTKRQ